MGGTRTAGLTLKAQLHKNDVHFSLMCVAVTSSHILPSALFRYLVFVCAVYFLPWGPAKCSHHFSPREQVSYPPLRFLSSTVANGYADMAALDTLCMASLLQHYLSLSPPVITSPPLYASPLVLDLLYLPVKDWELPIIMQTKSIPSHVLR